jgi:predicted ATP-grasp superfamily ATP-dependent carboligase
MLSSSKSAVLPHANNIPYVSRSTGLPGAIIIGGDYQGLGIVRSLGRRHIPICIIDNEHSIAQYSRYTKYHFRVAELQDHSRTIEQIIDIGRRHGLHGWVLFPTREETVAAFAHHRDQLSKYFRVPTPGWNTVRWAWDKRETYNMARQLGIPVPATWRVGRREDLSTLPIRFPVAIKPAIKEHFIYATKAKAWRADDWDQLLTLHSRAAAYVGDGEVMIQDYIPGDGQHQFAYCAFFKDGNSIGKLTARRVRQHPPEFGRASTYVETIDMPELEHLSEKFLRAIDYYGLVELEYKCDPRDGQLRLIDVNARTWGYHSIGAASGVDFPYMLFADQIGAPVESQQAKPGTRWVRLTTDVPTAVVELLRRRLDLRNYLRTLCEADTEAVFCRDDPMPGLVELGLIPYLYFRRGF